MMKYPILKISLTVAALLWLTGIYAQQPGEDGAFGGSKGVYVYLGPEMVSPSKPWNDIVAYRVFRTTANSDNWKLLQEVKAPSGSDEFRKRLDKAINEMPYPIDREDLPAEVIWNYVQQTDSLQQAWEWISWLPVRLALGLYYFDNTAVKETMYRYKIQYPDAFNNVLHEFEYSPTQFPAIPGFGKVFFKEASYTSGGLELSWEMENPKQLTWCELQRRETIDGPFRPVQATVTFFPEDDRALIYTLDPGAKADHFYAYRIVPVDYFGNRGNHSEEVKTGAYDFFLEVNLPDSMAATSSSNPPGILLSWNMQTNTLVNAIRIFRSDSYDGDYSELTTLNQGYGSFLDANVEPMKPYFYYFQLLGYDGELSPRSARFTGIFRADIPTSPPQIARAYVNNMKPSLDLLPSDDQTGGFLVYRRNHTEMKWILISGLLPVQNPFTVFYDSDDNLDPAGFYDYAVSAVSVGNQESELSEYVTIRPGGELVVPAVHALECQMNGKFIMITWGIPSSSNIQGFLVYRKSSETKENLAVNEFILLSDELLAVPVNRFNDTSVVAGNTYEYAIETVDVFGNKSEKVSTTIAFSSEKMIPAPQLLVIRKSGGFLIQWSPCYPENVQKVIIQRAESGKKAVTIADIPAASACEWLDENVAKGKTFTYSLWFEQSNGDKVQSNKATVRH